MDVIPSDLSNAALWAVIVGFVSPVVLNLLLQVSWPKWVQSLAAFVFSGVTGGLTAYFAGAFDNVGSVVTVILLVFVMTISTYQGFWKNITPRLKAATSVNAVQMSQRSDGSWERAE